MSISPVEKTIKVGETFLIDVHFEIEEGIQVGLTPHFFTDYDGVVSCDPYIGYVTGLEVEDTSLSVCLYFSHDGLDYEYTCDYVMHVVE